MPRIIMAVKDAFPDALVLADVALDPYTTSGHDGVVDEETGDVLNDMTVYQICKQVSFTAASSFVLGWPSLPCD